MRAKKLRQEKVFFKRQKMKETMKERIKLKRR